MNYLYFYLLKNCSFYCVNWVLNVNACPMNFVDVVLNHFVLYCFPWEMVHFSLFTHFILLDYRLLLLDFALVIIPDYLDFILQQFDCMVEVPSCWRISAWARLALILKLKIILHQDDASQQGHFSLKTISTFDQRAHHFINPFKLPWIFNFSFFFIHLLILLHSFKVCF